MFKISEINKSFYRVGEVALMLGVTSKTIQNYANDQKIEVARTEGGHRRISQEALIDFLSQKNLLYDDTASVKADVIYARVSNLKQEERADLIRQVTEVIESVPNLQNPIILKEVGRGSGTDREQIVKLIELVMEGKINNVYVTSKDRLAKSGYKCLEKIFLSKGTKIISLKDLADAE